MFQPASDRDALARAARARAIRRWAREALASELDAGELAVEVREVSTVSAPVFGAPISGAARVGALASSGRGDPDEAAPLVTLVLVRGPGAGERTRWFSKRLADLERWDVLEAWRAPPGE